MTTETEQRFTEQVRHDLAIELARIRRQAHHWRRIEGSRYDATYFKTIAGYIRELGVECWPKATS